MGRASEESDLVDVAALLDEVIDSIDPPPGFKVAVGAGMPCFEAPRVRLQQVFANLIGNAIKYHDRADGNVTVAVEERSEFYCFTVSDDGPGIGLTLVKKIVEDQSGEISLSSRLGEGAAFHFTWPKALTK